jgi:hypothetical protein
LPTFALSQLAWNDLVIGAVFLALPQVPLTLGNAVISNPTDPWRFECPRAFQTDQSWYEEYWYRDPAPRRPSFFNRSIASLGDAFQRLPVLLGQFAKIIRTGAVWDSRATREKQSQWWDAVAKPQMRAKDPYRPGHALPRREYGSGTTLTHSASR